MNESALKKNDSSSYTIQSCFKKKRVKESKSTEENSDRFFLFILNNLHFVRNELKSIENKGKPVTRPFAHMMTLKRNNNSLFL